MRLPASITAQPSETNDASHLAATHVDPTEVSDVEQTADERQPWWVRAWRAVADGEFNSVAAALIAVSGAIYVGMYHAPWVRDLASHRPTATQASEAMSVAMAAGPANAATPAPASAPAQAWAPAPSPAPAQVDAAAQPASPDRVAAARDRMEQRVYSQVQQPRARTVAERETIEESDAPAPGKARRHHRGTRAVQRSAPYNPAWYKGA